VSVFTKGTQHQCHPIKCRQTAVNAVLNNVSNSHYNSTVCSHFDLYVCLSVFISLTDDCLEFLYRKILLKIRYDFNLDDIIVATILPEKPQIFLCARGFVSVFCTYKTFLPISDTVFLLGLGKRQIAASDLYRKGGVMLHIRQFILTHLNICFVVRNNFCI
jgi:hypothetical protein